MTPLPRPRFSMLRAPGWPAIAGVVAFALAMCGAIGFGSALPTIAGVDIGVWLFLGIGIILFLALGALDKKLYLDRQSRLLHEHGLDLDQRKVDPDEAHPFIPLLMMTPTPIGPDNIDRWGELKNAGRRTIIGAASIARGRSEIGFVFVCVEAPLPTEPFMIGRRTLTRPKGRVRLDLQHPAFQKRRAASAFEETEDTSGIARLLEASGDAFVVPKVRAISFTVAEPPGRNEQWAYAQGWLTYAETGTAKAGPILDAVRLATTVAERLEDAALDHLEADPGEAPAP